MTFAVSGEAYDDFMGRYSRELAPAFADFAGIEPGQSGIDVGCGSGILTEELARRLGPENVAAADPSPLVETAAAPVPRAAVRTAPAQNPPWPHRPFPPPLAPPPIHFPPDPAARLVATRPA